MDAIGSSLDTTLLLQGKISGPNQPLSPKGLEISAPGSSDNNEGSPGAVLNNFGDMLKKQMDNINTLQSEANDAVQTYAVGGPVEMHTVMLSLEKAEMSLELATQVRNKLVAAYQDISRMQI